MPWGRIVKALSGFYYVLPEGQPYHADHLIQCRARGIFRMKGQSPLVGDRVRFEISTGREGTVVEIEPRSTELYRPPIANVTHAVIVSSIQEPRFSSLLLDRFLVLTEKVGLETIICLTKADLAEDEKQIESIVKLYENIGYRVVATSSKDGRGIGELKRLLAGKISVFAGQSGVGKSSLLNAMFPDYHLKTSEISHKLGRGRHTTRHVELLPVGDDGWVADTPGFSQLDFRGIEPEKLSHYFAEMRQRLDGCRFRGCLHVKEPDCQIRIGVEKGEIAESRYQHYLEFLQEVQEAKIWR